MVSDIMLGFVDDGRYDNQMSSTFYDWLWSLDVKRQLA